MAEEETTSRKDEATESGRVAAPAPVRKPETPKRKPKELPRYKLLLHNDDVNTFEHVIRSIVRVTPLCEEEAVVRTIEAHETGVSLLLVTHRERAELYVEQFASLKITTTIEPEE